MIIVSNASARLRGSETAASATFVKSLKSLIAEVDAAAKFSINGSEIKFTLNSGNLEVELDLRVSDVGDIECRLRPYIPVRYKGVTGYVKPNEALRGVKSGMEPVDKSGVGALSARVAKILSALDSWKPPKLPNVDDQLKLFVELAKKHGIKSKARPKASKGFGTISWNIYQGGASPYLEINFSCEHRSFLHSNLYTAEGRRVNELETSYSPAEWLKNLATNKKWQKDFADVLSPFLMEQLPKIVKFTTEFQDTVQKEEL